MCNYIRTLMLILLTCDKLLINIASNVVYKSEYVAMKYLRLY